MTLLNKKRSATNAKKSQESKNTHKSQKNVNLTQKLQKVKDLVNSNEQLESQQLKVSIQDINKMTTARKIKNSNRKQENTTSQSVKVNEMKSQIQENKQQDKKVQKKSKRQREDEEDEQEIVEHFDNQGYFLIPNQLEITQEDEEILKKFSLGLDGQTNKGGKKNNQSEQLADQLSYNIDKKIEEKLEQDIAENILNDPRVKTVYGDVAKLMKEYTSGKLSKAYMAIPLLEQWDRVLELTKPFEYSPQAFLASVKMFSSNLDTIRAKQFYETYVLPTIRNDINKNKKLNYHYYQALKKAFYKPAAWFKGILFQLCNEKCTIKEAQIIGSVLSKLSIPTVHSSVAILKLTEMELSAASIIFLKVMIEKKYSLPIRVINAILGFFYKFQNDPRKLPVIWYTLVKKFVQIYHKNLDDMQKEGLRKLLNTKQHGYLSQDIINILDNKEVNPNDQLKKNLQKSHGKLQNSNDDDMILE